LWIICVGENADVWGKIMHCHREEEERQSNTIVSKEGKKFLINK